jgi:hypothetical protein
MRDGRQTDDRRIARWAGVLFLITFIASIPALWLFQPVLDDPAGYIAGGGAQDARIYAGVVLEMIVVLANVATAVVLYPVLRRHSEVLSMGYIGARVIESTFIAVGIVAVLGIVSLGHDDPGASSLAVSLAALKDWTFLLGPGVMAGIGNGLILGYLLYRAALVPPRMAMLGIVGGPLLVAAGIGVLFGGIAAGGVVQSLATAPEFVWELGLGVLLTAVGFSAAERRTRPARPPAASGAPDPRPAGGATAATR